MADGGSAQGCNPALHVQQPCIVHPAGGSLALGMGSAYGASVCGATGRPGTTMSDGFDFEASLRLLQESDERWQQEDELVRGDGRRDALNRYAHVLVQLTSRTPSWVETVLHPSTGDFGETEVRALAGDALYVISNPWALEGAEVWPLVRIRPLSRLRGLDVEGFEFDEQGLPVGCTVTLLFDPGDTIRLGASPNADRRLMSSLLPSLLERLGV
jgi:hypothetical protein